jgi:hypothetical protein
MLKYGKAVGCICLCGVHIDAFSYARVFNCHHQLLGRQRARCEKKSAVFCQHAICLSERKYQHVFSVGPAVGSECCLPLNVSFFAALLVTVMASVAYFVVCAVIHHTSALFWGFVVTVEVTSVSSPSLLS